MTWRDSSTLVLTLRYVETPFCVTITCTFGSGGELQLEVRQNVSFGQPEPKRIAGRAAAA